MSSLAQAASLKLFCLLLLGFPGGSNGKESVCNAGDLDWIPGPGRSPGEGNGNPLQYSCLENSMDRGVLWAIIHGVTKSWTWLSDWQAHIRICIFIYLYMHILLTMLKEKKCRFNDYQIICSFLHDIFEAPSWKICSVVSQIDFTPEVGHGIQWQAGMYSPKCSCHVQCLFLKCPIKVYFYMNVLRHIYMYIINRYHPLFNSPLYLFRIHMMAELYS